MLLQITCTTPDARDLGWLLHKHPDRVQQVELSFGQAHIFYSQANAAACTACLLVEVDPVAIVRGKPGSGSFRVTDQYVNDRPYVPSSFLSVALAECFGTALAGRCAQRPELVDRPLDLEARLVALPTRRAGSDLLPRLFEPLGYTVEATRLPLDTRFPDWGESPYHDVTLRSRTRLVDLLRHLSVLVPVLDYAKHYWVGRDEVEKLLRRGEEWLAQHPERENITRRYLRDLVPLTREALARLCVDDDPDPDAASAAQAAVEQGFERGLSLNSQRHGAVLAALEACGARTVLDLGCGEGKLLRALLASPRFDRILGVDVSLRCLERAAERLRLDRLAGKRRDRIQLCHGSLVYRDRRLTGFDAACLVEVIEHLDPPRLAALERNVFAHAAPRTVIVTTPNVEYNVRFESLAPGHMRHSDHRFEWCRAEFLGWCTAVAAHHGYEVRTLGIGPDDPEVGAPTQMGVFTRCA